jgi:hypothetical protein
MAKATHPMKKQTFVIIFSDQSLETMYCTSKEVLDYAESKDNKFAVYTKAHYEAEFGPIQPQSSLLDKMQSAGAGKVKDKSEEEPENPHDPYKQCLIETIQKLKEGGDDVFTQAVNLTMKGERKDLNDRFETGDEVRFYMEDLESVSDPNVQKLVALLDTMEETMNSLANINGLKNEDLEL